MRHSTSARMLRTGALAAAALASTAALAEPSPALDRVSIWLGDYYANTELSIEGHDTAGVLTTHGSVDLTKGHENVGRARLDVLIWDSQGLTLDYYSLSHSSTQHLSREFDYAGIPFEFDTTLTGKLDFTAGSLAYHWWFGNANDVFGIGLGATYYRAKLGVYGNATLDGVTGAVALEWQESAVAPLLNVAWKHAFSDGLRVYANASGVKKNGGKLSGHIYDARVGLEWFPWQNAGFGAEYGASRVHLNRVTSHYGAGLDIELNGPAVFARFRF